ncbi:MAG: Unknown protein [uncultured Sulfurovum sp.]|uniref:PIN domain-containing protein n=1 Tax=uncultured Sulfurovum sp. TaxID=269237 RepID=A0A6S6SEU9_9BACT|nr:MAG: Unknown protein [uncultured Sulfurovum sp.]
MTYLDTNVLVYATLTFVDTQSQQDKAIEILKKLIDEKSLVLSSLNLLEYVFVMKKAKEDTEKIESALKLFQSFVMDENDGFSAYLTKQLNDEYAFKNSFDLYHVVFSNFHNCEKVITFDKGFKKFKDICKIDIL